MKKVFSLLLSVCMLCAMLPVGMITASAATQVVLFEEDFEDYNAGANISAKADTYGEWSQTVASAVSTIKAENVDDVRGKAAHFSHSGTSSGGPRLHKVFYYEQTPTNMTIQYDMKTKDCTVGLSLYYPDGSYQSLYSPNLATWTSVRVDVNFTGRTYVVYENNTKKKTGNLTGTDFSTLDFRFSVGVDPTRRAYLDNVKFTTTDNVDPVKVSNGALPIRTPEEIMAPFADMPAAPALSVPAGKYSLFTYDGALNANNGISTGTEVLFTKAARAMPAFLEEQPLIRITNDRINRQLGCLTKMLAVGTNPGTVTMEFYTLLSQSGVYVTLHADSTELVSTRANLINAQTPGVVDGWNKIKAAYDITNKRLNVYVNDQLAIENTAFTAQIPEGTYELTLGAYASLSAADTVLMDSFVMYQDNAAVVEGEKYFGVTGTNWDLVKAEITLTEDSYVNNLRSHPRLLVNDRAALIAKIENEPKVKAWYDSFKATADSQLDKEPYAYVFENGRNLKGVSGRIESRLVALGFAYLVEGDEKYAVRGLEEIRMLGTFPDWSNSSPILSSGIMFGVACFYDWCYNSATLTDAVKAEILEIVKAKSLWQFVRSYDGEISAEIAEGRSNRTTVANACGAGMAIAMADEEPELAQKLIDGAIKHVKQTVEAYSPDGAFEEGTSYWNYANNSMFNFLAEMDAATVDTYVKPEALQWYYEDSRLVNTPDYWAYMYGPGGNFDYGDSSNSFSAAALIYWHSQRHNKPFYGWFMERTLQRLSSSVGSKDFAMAYYDPNFEYYNDGSMPLDKTFNASDLAQVASMRSSWTAKNALFAAIQGGYNGASHMAKSLGTFVLDANGKRFVKQLGHVDYAALYDADLYYMERAEGNNTIIANPGAEIDQKSKARARFIAHGEAENEAFTVLDMTETNDAFTDAKRGMFMTKGRNSVVLQDEITTNKPSEIWWFAHTDADITLLEGGKAAIMTIGGEKMYVRITSGPADAVFTVMEAKMLMPEIAAPDADAMQVYTGQKLAIHLNNISDLTLTVEFVPLRSGEGIPSALTPVTPISTWSVSDNTISAKRQAGDALVMLAGSPSVLAYEEKFVFDTKDTTVAPFTQDGVVYVPAARAAELVYAKNTVAADSISITRNAVTTKITENIVTKNGVLYVPASALADALGMQLYTDANGLVVLSDRAVNYTAAQKQAIYDELNTCVYVNGKIFEAFTTDRTEYYVPFNEVMPKLSVSSGLAVNKTKTQASFSLNGKTYTFYRVDVEDAVSKYNTVLDKVVSSNKTMGTSYIPAYMTDGDLSTSAAVKATNEKNVTFTFELDAPHYMKEFILKDMRETAGSVMEKVLYSVRLEDGTWVDAGSVENLDVSGTRSGKVRTNVTTCTVDQPVTGVRFYMENTDDYINRIHVYEFEAIGVEKTEGMAETSTFTEYVKQDNTYNFTTEILQPPVSGYLVCVLKKGDTQVGMKIVPLSGKDVETYSVTAADCDNIQIMLIESFVRMRILATPEIL